MAKAESYKKTVKRWTRSDEVYQRDDFYASLTWFGTYHSDQFVRAKAKKISDIYNEQAEDRLKRSIDEFRKVNGFHVFYVGFYAYDFKFSDLATKDCAWKVSLEGEGHVAVPPAKIEKIAKPDTLDQVLFPHINVWSRHYLIYFPKGQGETLAGLKLNIRGPSGHSVLTW